jgi:multidrug efflux system outer membrane protein
MSARGWVVALASCTAACTVGPDYQRPELALPAHYLQAGPLPASRPASDPGAGAWWRALQDPVLDDLVTLARAGSYDLRVAAARVAETQALRTSARADQLPAVDATGSVQRVRESANSFFFGPGFPRERTQYTAGVETSWEVDLWGRVRRAVEAADADAGAAVALLHDALRVVVAEVAAEYVALRGAERELDVTRRNIEALRQSLSLTERLAGTGIGSHADVARARGQLRETEAAVPLLHARIAAGTHRLAVLTGGDAAALRTKLAAPSRLVESPVEPALGIPAHLLRARPDVRAAEHELAAATARIGVATAALYPRVSLNGRFGVDSTEGDALFESDSVSFGVGPALRWPLLDWGRTRAQIRAQGARQAAALARFEQRVVRAVTEVESTLVALRTRAEHRAALADAVAQNRESLRLIEYRYREGAIAFLEVLDAQRRVLALEAELARAQTALLGDFVTLNRALGADVAPAGPAEEQP